MDKTFDVGLVPLEVAKRVICLANVGLKEESARVLIWPVLRDRVLLFRVLFDRLDNLLKSPVLTDQFQCCRGSNLGNRVEVIAAEENA